ncbi:hypothetical protein [Kribbella italica]|uniref:Uncharacterized protein n=1 Tax=Kribbella italica TaxID=1540520 RepID=A0A7W9JG55_9ACTN|nr:hypothetical protein [Kribbella italica]MBB5841526.1 hypothetical protein [Kribbella italica]
MLILRLAAVTIAAVTAMLLLIGDHPPEFVVADLLVVALLTIAAVLPAARGAGFALAIGFGAGLGVFTVAFVGTLNEGPASWPLATAVLGCLAGLALSWRQYGEPARS